MGKVRDLSVLIAARNEEFLAHTVEDVLAKKRGNTEVIAVCDGNWPNPPVKDHPDVTLVYHAQSIGQRAAINEAAKFSKAKFIMKLDAHCLMDEGFDVKLMADCEYDWTVVPRLYNLHAFDWKCKKCGNKTYQGPTMTKCEKCGGGQFERVMVWQPRWNRKTDFMRFDKDLRFGYWGSLKNRSGQEGEIADTMSLLGACFFMHRERYWELGGSEESWGSWGQQGTEWACKTWLSGGRVVANKKTWYSHLFRTQGGDFGFPYPQSGKQVEHARQSSRDLFFNNKWPKQKYPLSWLIEKFWPIPGWEEEDLARLKSKSLAVALAPGWHDGENLPYFRQVETECIVCGKKYSVKPSRENKTKCCSLECIGKYRSKTYKGRKFTEEHKQKIAKAMRGENHRLWKGDDVSYKTLHDWVRRHKGNPQKCQFCDSINTLNWANKSHEYRRDLEDWLPLCKRCHWRYDNLTRSVVYYTDNRLNLKIARACQKKLLGIGLPIVSVSLKPMTFGRNIHLPLARGYLTMFKQILAGLEASDAEIIFFCEHDVLYHPSHFEFTPDHRDVYYYNTNFWKVRAEDGHGVKVDDCRQVSGLCAYRELLIGHYRERVKRVEEKLKELGDGENFRRFIRQMGFEPGTHNRAERVDDYKSKVWESELPNVDIRHENTLTPSRWKKDQFRNQRYTRGWQESDSIPGWPSIVFR